MPAAAGDRSNVPRLMVKLVACLAPVVGVLVVVSVWRSHATVDRDDGPAATLEPDPPTPAQPSATTTTTTPSLPAVAVAAPTAPPEPEPAPPQQEDPPAAPAPAPTPPKRLVVTPAELAAERTRIALAQLAPRQEELVRSGDTSGEAVPAWQDLADGTRNELSRSLTAITGIRVSALTCHRAGCSFSFDAADDTANVQASARLKMLLRGEMQSPFPGDNFVSGLESRPDGSLRTTVLLYAPGTTREAVPAK